MTETTRTPTRVALAAKELMESISSAGYQQAIENAAILGGWVGAREAGCYDTTVSDAVTKRAVASVMNLFRQWAEECGGTPDATEGERVP